MGTILAMKHFMITGALLALTACGSMNKDNVVIDQLAGLVGLGPAPTPPKVPDIANAAPGDLVMATLVNRQAVAAMTRIASNNGTDTYRSPGNTTIALRDGIIIATRGLNDDLMGADVSGVIAAMNAGGGTATRTHSYLDSLDGIRTLNLTCTITAAPPETITTLKGAQSTATFKEFCDSQQLSFTNTYWRDLTSGAILQSQQAISPKAGYIVVNPL